jgi:hypothetical protein
VLLQLTRHIRDNSRQEWEYSLAEIEGYKIMGDPFQEKADQVAERFSKMLLTRNEEETKVRNYRRVLGESREVVGYLSIKTQRPLDANHKIARFLNTLKFTRHPNHKKFKEELQITDRIFNLLLNPALERRWETALEQHIGILKKYHLDLFMSQTRRDVELAHRAKLALQNPSRWNAAQDARDYIKTLERYGFFDKARSFDAAWRDQIQSKTSFTFLNRKISFKEQSGNKPSFFSTSLNALLDIFKLGRA